MKTKIAITKDNAIVDFAESCVDSIEIAEKIKKENPDSIIEIYSRFAFFSNHKNQTSITIDQLFELLKEKEIIDSSSKRNENIPTLQPIVGDTFLSRCEKFVKIISLDEDGLFTALSSYGKLRYLIDGRCEDGSNFDLIQKINL
jgi:hypothetical protein